MKLIRDMPDTRTPQEIINICEDLQKEGRRVVIEHLGDRIKLYDEGANIEVEKLKALYKHLASDAPTAYSPHRDEYEETMRQLEAELRDKGVKL